MKRFIASILFSAVAAFVLAPSIGWAKTAKECNVEYKTNKAAIKGAHQKKKDFISACRAGTETVPTGAATPAVPVTPAQSRAPAQTAAPSATERKSRRTETTAPVSASEAQAQSSCPGGTVVWVNTRSGVYHFKGTHNYGTTKHGTYMCETAAKTAGDRAAKNEQHP